MKNAHLRIGTLEFRKVTRDTTLAVRVWLDRLILECEVGATAKHTWFPYSVGSRISPP
jgi:hypothetical protein